MKTFIHNKKEGAAAAKLRRCGSLRMLKKSWVCYLFILPMVVYIVLFNYIPMYGIQLAFKDYKPLDGIWGSAWVGMKHFKTFFESYQFSSLLKNTLALSVYSLVAGFPLPIVFALLLNYITHNKMKKSVQMITYAPHFISTVVFCGMLLIFLSSDGIINQLLKLIGIEPVGFLSNPKNFRHIYVWSDVIKNIGWGSIIYISVLSSVGQELHEAARVDGASKFQRLRYIDFPSIVPTMIIMLIMRAGEIMEVGFEKAFLLQNSINLDYSEIISTYVYKIGIQGGQFSYSAAIGLFNNVINLILLLAVNRIARKMSDVSLW
ncbi:putative aldouronate transport system permease protein [Hungatella effluvii]|uniref:Putative aldouronate transport system permease protein n=1 Tax=Hungatella effluvii TaxID=1096246 RepID=A0A2V3Y2X7_9FIRM|nr:ABC transporter permease subunit [Hungatella effluvii]PXX51474.1 putative aldouronate transport system permease protein [Hungatella effluvii]